MTIYYKSAMLHHGPELFFKVNEDLQTIVRTVNKIPQGDSVRLETFADINEYIYNYICKHYGVDTDYILF